VGVYEFEGFSTIHSSKFGVKMNMSSKMAQNFKSWMLSDIFPDDPFFKLTPVYQEMGFKYNSSTTQDGNKSNFNAFCDTVNSIIAGALIDKLKIFSDRIKQYGMSSFMEYIQFVNYLTSTVGQVGNLVELMTKVQTYIKSHSGITVPESVKGKTGQVKLYTGETVEIFSYQIVKWFISSGLMQNGNLYGVSNKNGISFTGYVSTLNNQNWTYGNTMSPTINANANYVESEVRGNIMANKTYKSVTYNPDSDPSKMQIDRFIGMVHEAAI
jgi:hypothetical protein